MVTNNFKTIAEIINHTLFFNFINKQDGELTYDYIFIELLEFYCGQNSLALAQPGELIPSTRKKLIKHISTSKESGLRIPKRRTNLKKNLREKIRKILSAPYKHNLHTKDESKAYEEKIVKHIEKEFEKRNIKIAKLDLTAAHSISNFSIFNNIILESFRSIDSLGPHTLFFLGNAKRILRTKESLTHSSEGHELLKEIKRIRDKFRYIIEEIDKDFNVTSDKDISFQDRKSKWELFLKEDNINEHPFFLDLKNLLLSLNNISQRDSQLHTQVKVCKYKQECDRPYFYAYDKAQTICGSKKCRKRSRKSK